MMKSIPKAERIADVGLRAYLDKTKDEHNDLGYDNFVSMINSGVNKSNLGRAFGVNRDTIYRWIRIKDTESLDA